MKLNFEILQEAGFYFDSTINLTEITTNTSKILKKNYKKSNIFNTEDTTETEHIIQLFKDDIMNINRFDHWIDMRNGLNTEQLDIIKNNKYKYSHYRNDIMLLYNSIIFNYSIKEISTNYYDNEQRYYIKSEISFGYKLDGKYYLLIMDNSEKYKPYFRMNKLKKIF